MKKIIKKFRKIVFLVKIFFSFVLRAIIKLLQKSKNQKNE